MARQADTARTDEIARVAYAIWEAEGRADDRDHEHWMKAKQLIEEGRANSDHPGAATEGDSGETPPARAGIVTAGLEAACPWSPQPGPPSTNEYRGVCDDPERRSRRRRRSWRQLGRAKSWRRQAASEAEPIRARNREETVRGSHLCPASGTQADGRSPLVLVQDRRGGRRVFPRVRSARQLLRRESRVRPTRRNGPPPCRAPQLSDTE